MRSLPDKLALNDGDPKAQVAEYANSWTHGGPQQAHRQQPNHTEEAEQPSESHFACTRYADLQQHIKHVLVNTSKHAVFDGFCTPLSTSIVAR